MFVSWQFCQELVGLHQISDEADCRLWGGVQAVIKPGLLNGDVVQPESTLGAGEPGFHTGSLKRR